MSSKGQTSTKKALERDLWLATPNDDPSVVLYPRAGMLCRMIVFGLLTIVASLVGISTSVWLAKNAATITVPDTTDTIDVLNCYVTTDPSSLKSTNNHVSITAGQTMTLTGRDSGLCAVRLKIPTTRTAPLTIRATASTIILQDNDVDYKCVVDIKSLNAERGTLRMQVSGVGFVGLNVSVPDGILILNARKKLPTHINARLDWGVVSFPYSSAPGTSIPQKVNFHTNVSLGGYCVETQAMLNVWINDDVDWNNTIVQGTIYPGATTTRTSTVVVNASSVYIMTSPTQKKLSGPLMNETQKIRPYIERMLIDTNVWLQLQTNRKYVTAVDVVAPYAGALFLNTNGAFMLEFGVELLSLLSGFMLTPSYRRLSSALNHYQCNSVSTMISDVSTGVLMSPFDSVSIGTNTIDASTKVYISDETIASVFDAIENNTAGVSTLTAVGLVSLELSRNVRPDTTLYSIGVALDGTVIKNVIHRSGGQWALFAFSIAIGMYVAVGLLVLIWFYRFEILRVVYLQESRAFVRETTQMRASRKCPYWSYFSLYSIHALAAFHIMRFVSYAVYNTFPEYMTREFSLWVLKVLDAEEQDAKNTQVVAASQIEKNRPRMIPVSQLVDKYATYWARRYMPRIDLPRAKFIRVLQENLCKVSTQRLATVVGIAHVAMNTERGGQYVFNELYRTTGTEFDVVSAATVANELFSENPLLRATESTVVEEAEALLLPISHVDEPTVTNATWSGVWLLESNSMTSAEEAERAFGSFPSAMEVRPNMDWPEIPPEGYGAVRDEIKLYFLQFIKRYVMGIGQGLCHTVVVVLPFVIGTAMMSMYVHESVKYSVTNHFLDGFEVFFSFNFIDNMSLTIDFVNVQLAMTVASLCFCAFAVLEPICLLFFRLTSDEVGVAERIVMWPLTGLAMFLYTISIVVCIGYFICVLIWWILAAIVAPETMLAFASSAICLLGALGATYRTIISSRDSIVGRVKERILEFLIDFLKKSGVNVDAAGAGAMFGVEGITVDLLIDVADGDVAALEKLATIMKIPPPLLTSANAVQTKDAKRMRESTEALLTLVDVPKEFHEPMHQILLRAAGVPAPMSALTHSFYNLHPDKEVRGLLRKADYVIIQCLEAIMDPDLLDLSKIMNAVVATGTEFLVEESLKFANKKAKEYGESYVGTEMVITRDQCKSVLDWGRSAMSQAKKHFNSDGSVVDDAAAQLKLAARHHKIILAKLKEMLHMIQPLLSNNEELEMISLLVVAAVDLALGGDPSVFTNALLAAGETVLNSIDLCPNEDVLLLMYTITEIDPVFRQFLVVMFKEELEDAGVDIHGEGDASKAKAEAYDDDDDYDYDDDDEDDDDEDYDDDWEEDGSVASTPRSPRNKAITTAGQFAAASPSSTGSPLAPGTGKNPRAYLVLVEHVVKLLTGAIKLTTRVNEQRFVTTLLQICFSEPADAVKLIDVLNIQTNGAEGIKIDPQRTFDDAKKVVELFVQSVQTDKRVRSKTKEQLAKGFHPLSVFIGYHWALLMQIVMPAFTVDDSIKSAFRPNYRALKKCTDISKSALGAFEHVAELALYVSNLIAKQISGAIGISAADIFELVKGALSNFSKLLPQAASSADGLFGSAKSIIAKVHPGIAEQLDAQVPKGVLSTAQDPNAIAAAQGAAYQQASSAATSAISQFPSLLFRLLRGAAPSFGGGGNDDPTDDEVEHAKKTGSFSFSMLTSSSLSMPDIPFAQLAKTLYNMMTKVGKLVMSTVLQGSGMPSSLLSDTGELFADMGRIVIDQVYSLAAPDIREIASDFMHLLTQAGYATTEQLNRLAKKMGINASQIKMLFFPSKTLVEGVCPWAAFLYRLANRSFTFSSKDPMFKMFIEKNSAGIADVTGDEKGKKLNLQTYLAHFAPALDKEGKPEEYVQYMSAEGMVMDFDDIDDYGDLPEMFRFPLRYPAFSPKWEKRQKKNGLLFCVMVNPHPLCFEAIYLTDMLDAFIHFFNNDLPFGTIKSGWGGFADAALVLSDKEKSSAASAIAAAAAAALGSADGVDGGGPATGRRGSTAGGMGTSAASGGAAGDDAAVRTIFLRHSEVSALQKRWELLLDMVLTTMPTLARLVSDRNIRDTKSTSDWLQALEIFVALLHSAMILESDEVEVDDEGKIKPFKKTKEFSSWEKIAKAGLEPKVNLGPASLQKKIEKTRKEAGAGAAAKIAKEPEDEEHRTLWKAMGTANPFLLFDSYEELSTGQFFAALVFFNRCHGLPEIKIDVETRQDVKYGYSDAEETIEHKAVSEMPQLAAFATLLTRRTDLPICVFARLLKRVPVQFSKIITDLLTMRCGGLPFLGDNLKMGLAAFPSLTREFKKMNLDQVGSYVVDFFTMLHGRANGFTIAQSLGGLGDMSKPVDFMLDRKKAARAAANAALASAAGDATAAAGKASKSSAAAAASAAGAMSGAGASASGAATSGVGAANSTAGHSQEAAKAAAAAARAKTDELKKKHQAHLEKLKKGAKPGESLDAVVLKRFAMLIVRGDTLSISTAFIMHAMKLFKDTISADFSFFKGLLLVMFAADELDLSKMTDDAKQKMREMKNNAASAFADPHKKAGGILAAMAAEGGGGAKSKFAGLAAKALASGGDGDEEEDEEEWEEVDEEYWEDEEFEVPFDSDDHGDGDFQPDGSGSGRGSGSSGSGGSGRGSGGGSGGGGDDDHNGGDDNNNNNAPHFQAGDDSNSSSAHHSANNSANTSGRGQQQQQPEAVGAAAAVFSSQDRDESTSGSGSAGNSARSGPKSGRSQKSSGRGGEDGGGGGSTYKSPGGAGHDFDDDDDDIEEEILEEGDDDDDSDDGHDGDYMGKTKIVVRRVKKTRKVRRRKNKTTKDDDDNDDPNVGARRRPDHDDSGDDDDDSDSSSGGGGGGGGGKKSSIGFDLDVPSMQELSGYSPFLFALLDHLSEGQLGGACSAFDASLEPILSVLKNPTQALLDMCPFGEESKEWHAMSLVVALVMNDWETAMLCVKKLVVALDAEPGIQKLVNIILRVASIGMSGKEEDRVAMAKAVTCDVLDLASSEESVEPYKIVFTLGTKMLREEPLENGDYQGMIDFMGEHVLSEFMEEDKKDSLIEFAKEMAELFSFFGGAGGALALSSMSDADDEFDIMSFVEHLLDCDLLVPENYKEEVAKFRDFFSGRIMPIRRKASQLLKDGETASSLMAKVELPMLMELVQFSASEMPGDVATKVVLISKLLSGDFTAIGPVLESIGVDVPEEMLAVLQRVLQLVKTLGAHKGLGDGASAGAQASFINALTDFVFDQFSNGTDNISFNATVAMLDRMHMSMPAAEAKALFAEVDADDSGAIDREEFKVLISKLQDMLFNRVLDYMGMSPSQLIVVLVALGVNLVLVLAFLLLGVRTFADGSQFTASTSAMLPFFATAGAKMEGTVDQLMVQADKAVSELMLILNSKAE